MYGTKSASCGRTIGRLSAEKHKKRTKVETNIMNWNQIEGPWNQVTGQVKSKWAKLADDDLENVGDKRDQLIGKVQERYGIFKEEAEKQVNEWITKFVPTPGKHEPSANVQPATKP